MSTKTAVDPREAAFAVNVGDWLTVAVDGHGGGWTITAVHQHTYDLWRDGRDLAGIPHRQVHPDR